MHLRVLQLLGGLLAVAILAVGAAAATAGTGNSGNSGNSGNCPDNYPPSSQWGNGWRNGHYWNGWGDGNGYFDGQSQDNGCSQNRTSANAAAQVPGSVSHVMVAVNRMRGSRCQHMSSSGRLSNAGSCKRATWIQANGTTSWRHQINKRLPRGLYRLHQYAVDQGGNRERVHSMRVRIR
jgi:hypothetical protein